MNWKTGLKRLRLVATLALAIGLVLCTSVLVTRGLGYSPDAEVAPLFAAMWPSGVALILVGALLWVAVWVLHGFLPPRTGFEPGAPSAVAQRDRVDP